MTHDELLARFTTSGRRYQGHQELSALRAVVELHKPVSEPATTCSECPAVVYPCPTIQAIEKELV